MIRNRANTTGLAPRPSFTRDRCGAADATVAEISDVNTTDVAWVPAEFADVLGNYTGSSVTASGACWGTSTGPTTSGSHTDEGAGPGGGVIDTTIGALVGATRYYIRCYATNAAGTVYGEEIEFVCPVAAPTDLDEPIGWWDADDIPGLADNAPLDTIAGWQSHGSGAYGPSFLPIATTEPTYHNTAGVNGKPCVQFNGTSQFLIPDDDLTKSASDYTFIMIGRQNGTGTRQILELVNGAVRTIWFRANTVTTALTSYKSGTTIVTWDTAITGVSTMWLFSLTNGSPKVRVNGVDKTGSGSSYTQEVLDGNIRLGSNSSNTASFFSGFMCEIILYDRALTRDEMIALEDGYIATKYAL